MRLDNILKGIEVLETTGRQDKDITYVTSYSRQCTVCSLYIDIY